MCRQQQRQNEETPKGQIQQPLISFYGSSFLRQNSCLFQGTEGFGVWVCSACRQTTPGERSSLCHLFVTEMLIPGCAASHPTVQCRHPVPGADWSPWGAGDSQQQGRLPQPSSDCEAEPGSGEARPGEVLPWLWDTHTHCWMWGRVELSWALCTPSSHTAPSASLVWRGHRAWQDTAAPRETQLTQESCPHRKQDLLTRPTCPCTCKLNANKAPKGSAEPWPPATCESQPEVTVFSQCWPVMPQWWIKGRPPPLQVPGSHCG